MMSDMERLIVSKEHFREAQRLRRLADGLGWTQCVLLLLFSIFLIFGHALTGCDFVRLPSWGRLLIESPLPLAHCAYWHYREQWRNATGRVEYLLSRFNEPAESGDHEEISKV